MTNLFEVVYSQVSSDTLDACSLYICLYMYMHTQMEIQDEFFLRITEILLIWTITFS